jgi:hypothetical protein
MLVYFGVALFDTNSTQSIGTMEKSASLNQHLSGRLFGIWWENFYNSKIDMKTQIIYCF